MDDRSDLSNGQASKPYSKMGMHLVFINCKVIFQRGVTASASLSYADRFLKKYFTVRLCSVRVVIKLLLKNYNVAALACEMYRIFLTKIGYGNWTFRFRAAL